MGSGASVFWGLMLGLRVLKSYRFQFRTGGSLSANGLRGFEVKLFRVEWCGFSHTCTGELHRKFMDSIRAYVSTNLIP